MGARVLLAEDDVRQAEIVRRYLVRDGYEAIVVHDGRAAIDEARRRRPDLLVLDVMMPRVDGLDVCRALRGESDAPMLMLTARASEEDLLLALDLGADDYMTKPYSPRELMARVRALLRRARRAAAAAAHAHDGDGDGVLRCGALEVDARRHRVRLDGREVDCTPGEFQLLATLAAEPDRVFTRGQLLTAIHGSDAWVTERTVDVHVMNLRKKIERDARRPRLLLTVFGVGYKLTEPS